MRRDIRTMEHSHGSTSPPKKRTLLSKGTNKASPHSRRLNTRIRPERLERGTPRDFQTGGNTHPQDLLWPELERFTWGKPPQNTRDRRIDQVLWPSALPTPDTRETKSDLRKSSPERLQVRDMSSPKNCSRPRVSQFCRNWSQESQDAVRT
jgi:hypothetical protein